MYFRNKFHDEFFYYCEHITPRGAETHIDECDNPFFEFKQNPHTNRVLIIPLILFNKINSSFFEDEVLEDYAVLCKNTPDTLITCSYDENYKGQHEDDFVCEITKDSGDYI
ncbi:hypothetical protein [Methanosphaera sp.]|uniref:hypothetical protein n=1 Tax=Methanosphaera sp. TaxID=2666342 RepID=UPI0025F25E95|nr:hypothetical protein [Methanosphaera sp.]